MPSSRSTSACDEVADHVVGGVRSALVGDELRPCSRRSRWRPRCPGRWGTGCRPRARASRRSSGGSAGGRPSGTPTISQITSTGNGPAKSSTASKELGAVEVVEEPVDHPLHDRLPLGDAARREGAVHQLAQPVVHRRVQHDDRRLVDQRPAEVLAAELVERHAAGRRVGGDVAVDLDAVLVAGHGVEAELLVEVHRRLVAQPAVDVPRVLEELGAVGVEPHQASRNRSSRMAVSRRRSTLPESSHGSSVWSAKTAMWRGTL